MSAIGRFVWIELETNDPAGAKKFYSSLVGWGAAPSPTGGDYEMWSMGGNPQGGLMKLPPELEKRGVPVHWMGYIGVENVDQTAAKAKELGGSVKHEPTDIPNMGRFAVLADPQGAVFGVFQGSKGMEALSRTDLGGLGWAELNTVDWKSAWKFYSALFGWQKVASMEMPGLGEYFMFGPTPDGESTIGGMSDAVKGGEFPPHWLYYINVKNVDEAAKRIPELGGKVITQPMDVPGGSRIINAQDPQGGNFALVSGGESK